MAHWLVKSEPGSWSWQQQVEAGTTSWDGVRNPQALKNLKAMRLGDRAFFYHSGDKREVVGIAEVTREYYPDPRDPSGRLGMVDISTVEPLAGPITLGTIKADPRFANLALVRQPRLSVMPIDADAWQILCGMGGVDP